MKTSIEDKYDVYECNACGVVYTKIKGCLPSDWLLNYNGNDFCSKCRDSMNEKDREIEHKFRCAHGQNYTCPNCDPNYYSDEITIDHNYIKSYLDYKCVKCGIVRRVVASKLKPDKWSIVNGGPQCESCDSSSAIDYIYYNFFDFVTPVRVGSTEEENKKMIHEVIITNGSNDKYRFKCFLCENEFISENHNIPVGWRLTADSDLLCQDHFVNNVSDKINHPSHYNQIPNLECIDVIKHFDFITGSIIKYAWRAGLSSTESKIDDLNKCEWYVKKAIEREEGPQTPGRL